jgi:hypothetical protein
MSIPALNSKPDAVAPMPSTLKFWPRELVLGALPLLLALQLMLWALYLPAGLHGICVFRSFYTCGYMLRTHERQEIYDQRKHLELADQLVPLAKPLNQGMDHPAYEALLFAPISLLSYESALGLFITLNIALLCVSTSILSRLLLPLSTRWKAFSFFLAFSFFPVTYAITGGNDSIILFALLTVALALLRSRHDFNAGMITGLGLFKFQIVIPIAVIYLVWRNWRFVKGFIWSAAATGMVSTMLVGFSGLRQYVSMLMHMSVGMRTEADALQFALSPRTMLNIRGICSAFLSGYLGHWGLQLLIFVLSAAVILATARLRPSMPLAIIAAALVSYHLNAPDAVVLLIPIGTFLCSRSVWAGVAAICGLILPTFAVAPMYGFVGGGAVVGLFAVYLSGLEVFMPEENPTPAT